MTTNLTRTTSNGPEEYSLWVEGKRLHFVRAFYYDCDSEEGSTRYGSAVEAQAALDERVSKLLADGYEVEGGKPARRTEAAPSRARKAKPPAWLSKLPAPLERQRKKLEAAAKKAGLSHRYAEIEALLKPSIALTVKKAKAAPRGVVSRFGGDPDLKKGVGWPEHEGRPLHFVAQIVLEEMAPFDLEGLLQRTGRLIFFVGLDPQEDDYATVARVLWLDDESPVRVPAPKGAASPMSAVGLLTPKGQLALPYYEDPVIDALKLNDDERSRYHDEVFLGAYPENPVHLLLGYPSYGTPYGVDGHRFLAQLDSDQRLGFSEGDSETLRFYFASKRPKKKDLDSVVVSLEQA
jgi:hypothetical protein